MLTKMLLYCTKAKPYLYQHFDKKFMLLNTKDETCWYNGKIVGECEFEVEDFSYRRAECIGHTYINLLKKSCLTDEEMYDYLQGKNGYAIHIKNLIIYDKPENLDSIKINKAPQNMMRCKVWLRSTTQMEKCVLISIRPQWLCKILNGEKTIEVRKRVLKEMM